MGVGYVLTEEFVMKDGDESVPLQGTILLRTEKQETECILSMVLRRQ